MSEYSNFSKDFITRTKNIIISYSGEYEVTSLINNCLGLIIIPKELLYHNLPNYTFSDNDKRYGISKKNIEKEIDDDYSLKNIVRHIRNGLSHGRIEQKSKNGEIIGVRIFDRYNNSSLDNFSVNMSVQELKKFVVKVSDDFLG